MQISKEALDFKGQLSNLRKPQNLCICGLLIALYIVLSIYRIPINEFLEIRFGFLAFIAGGMMGGPVMGITVGFLGDTINSFLFGYPYFPGFSFSYALSGALFGLILYKSRPTKLRAVLCALVEFLIGMTFTTCWLYIMYGTPLSALIPLRFTKCGLSFFINVILIYAFIEALQRIIRAAIPANRL